MAQAVAANYDSVVILDFGSQFSHLIVRRIRELGVYCELHSCLSKASLLEGFGDRLKGVIFSGGPFSVYDEGSPHVDASVWSFLEARNIPVMGVCYGLQELCNANEGRVEKGEKREFGHAEVRINAAGAKSPLLAGIPESFVAWMSHGDKVTKLAPGLDIIASSDNCEAAIVEGTVRGCIRTFGVQYHPEVSHSQFGTEMLKNFCLSICGVKADWTMASFVDEAIASIRARVGPTQHVIGAVSGGVDSSVAAVLLNRAVGDRFHAILVDNGLLRLNEKEKVLEMLKEKCGVNLRAVDASEQFLTALKGLTEPEQKRKAIGRTFVQVFEAEARSITTTLPEGHTADFLLQGTLYTDCIESSSFKGPSSTIKSHHNTVVDDLKLALIEPLRELFKDEVRALGLAMGLPRDVLFRHPFPGPGLGIRILGEVTKQQCDLLRRADDIFISELRSSGLYDSTGQAFVVLLPENVKSVGVMGDARTYEQVCVIRAITSSDFMTASVASLPMDFLLRVATRIVNEVRGINRCTYDLTSKPPGTIEWE